MKRRNREVNIFNMSLLDILCGALGAFCFMMLSLLPYYRPPGKNINITKEQKDLLDEVQKIKDLAERLKNTSTAEDQRELVRLLREEIGRLENEIKKLQGQVNALYAENDALRERVAKLEVENGLLRTRNVKLEQENQQLLAEKQQLLAEREQLRREKEQLVQQKQQLEGRLAQRQAWTVAVFASDARVTVDCSLHEQIIKAEDNSRQGEFDPALPVQPTTWTGDFRLGGTGSVTRVNASRFVGGESKFYISASSGRSAPNAPGALALPVVFDTQVTGPGLAPVPVRQVKFHPERSWIYVGKFRIESYAKITFTEATLEEREQEWVRLTKAAEPKKPQPTPPVPTPPPLPDSVMGPGFTRRKKEYESMAGGNAPPGLKVALLSKWEAEAETDREKNYVRSMIARVQSGMRETGPGPGPRGPSTREEIEEIRRRREQSLQPTPAPPPQLQPQQK